MKSLKKINTKQKSQMVSKKDPRKIPQFSTKTVVSILRVSYARVCQFCRDNNIKQRMEFGELHYRLSIDDVDQMYARMHLKGRENVNKKQLTKLLNDTLEG